jgi:hypothetical protein
VIPVKKPADMRPSSDSRPMTPGSGGMKSSGNGTDMSSGHHLPTLPTTRTGDVRSGDLRSGTGSERPPASGTRGPIRVIEY